MKKERIYNLLLFILIFLSILSTILIVPIDNLDEIWNYNFARNIANRLIPYKDFNMLQMPLLPFICGIILKVIANELIVMRILAALLCSTIFYLIYKLFNILNIKRELSIIFTFLIGILFKAFICIDYNYATLLVVLYIIYNEIKEYKSNNKFIVNNFKKDLFLGILAGLTITLKQTTGLFISIALLGNKLMFVREKREFIIYFKSFIFRFIGIIIPVNLIVIYLLATGAFSEFIRYTILGVSGFSNYTPYTNLIKFDLVGILSILVPITFIYEWIRTIILEKDKISYIFLVYGLALFVVCFPISDTIHFLIGSTPIIILLLYKLFEKTYDINESEKSVKKIILFIYLFIILFLVYYSLINIKKYLKNSNFSNYERYKYIPISEQFENQIKNVNDYINSIDTEAKILDATAAMYMIPNNKYNKNYDMLLRGNLGKNGENNLIKEIEEDNNVVYLILKNNYDKNWQTPIEIIDFVISNKEKIGEIECFDIYK